MRTLGDLLQSHGRNPTVTVVKGPWGRWEVLGMNKIFQVTPPATILQISTVAWISNPDSLCDSQALPWRACYFRDVEPQLPAIPVLWIPLHLEWFFFLYLLSANSKIVSFVPPPHLVSCVKAASLSPFFSSLFTVSSSAHRGLLEGRGQVPSRTHSFQELSCLPSALMTPAFGERPTQ